MIVVVGGGGVLGSGFRHAVGRRRQQVVQVRPDWARVESLTGALRPHLADGTSPVVLVWAAGVGGVGATDEALAVETRGLDLLAAGVRRMPPAARRRLSVVFASSAGALYAGHGSTPITEEAPPAPTSAYGRVKLGQEQALRRLAEETGCRVLACRYSNLYGLAAGRLTARGLVSTAIRATRHRQPMTVYVAPDCRRDYVFAADAAESALSALEHAEPGFSTALICTGEVRTVASVISLVGHVSGRRVPVSYAERPATRLQPPVLRFLPQDRGLRLRRTPMETAVHGMIGAPVA